MDEPGAQPEKPAGIQPEAALAFGKQVAQKDVRFPDEAVHHLCSLAVVQVHGNGALAAVVDIELEVVAPKGGFDLERPAQSPHRVAIDRLDLHHPGAHVGKQRSRARRGHEAVDLHHGDIVQGSAHTGSSSLLKPG